MEDIVSASFFSYSKEIGSANQDTILPPMMVSGGWLFAIADGLGGYNGGKLASSAVIDFISKNFENLNPSLLSGFFETLKEEVKKLSQFDKNLVNAASTLTLCYIKDDNIQIAHIGDCRLYIKENNKLKQITKDHTQHQSLIDQGIFTARELKYAQGKNILTTAISRTLDLEYEFKSINLNEIDEKHVNIFIMSDGAHSFWEKRPRFSVSTLEEPSKFSSSLLRRIKNGPPVDDYSLIAIKLRINQS